MGDDPVAMGDGIAGTFVMALCMFLTELYAEFTERHCRVVSSSEVPGSDLGQKIGYPD